MDYIFFLSPKIRDGLWTCFYFPTALFGKAIATPLLWIVFLGQGSNRCVICVGV